MSYESGKIYIIKCGDYFYYGSCITTLARRATTHRYRSKNTEQKKYSNKLYNYIKDKEWTIELVYEYVCNNKSELLMKENEYIKSSLSNPFSLNDRCSVWDKDKDDLRKKEWYNANKERILEKLKKKYHCKK